MLKNLFCHKFEAILGRAHHCHQPDEGSFDARPPTVFDAHTMRELLLVLATARACSNILVTKGASSDGKAHVSYNADDAALMGAVSHWPGGAHAAGSTRETYSWDSGVFLGRIPQPERTLNAFQDMKLQGLMPTVCPSHMH